ncbi:methionyl-tRNA formyltransferase [Fodinisporobacter ferrooxydans]|uniref:Methionyl-tRNA formyltransferase n=1 Tax=Fodinisporobacter ferrooxydans TaxID=2901836 RepID=A0ABY4CF89_9BACL|nr:methionyl-tRNA formyltransferase [Alicyclobacillaceae bacterium MYW30-H2]
MRVIFMGTPDFAVPSLQTLLQDGHEIVAVVTQPDRPKGRKREMTPPPVKQEAVKHGLPIFQPERLRNSQELEQLLTLEPDVLVTAAYGQLLPKQLLELPKHGCVNVHASLLPKYRGGAPIQRCLLNGEQETGVTIMEMIPKLDAGGIYRQVRIPIEDSDDVGTLHDKLSVEGAKLLHETLPEIAAGTLLPTPQREAEATFAPNITRDDEQIDWSRTNRQIFNQVRALRPWPGAFTSLQGSLLKIWDVQEVRKQREETDKNELPGTIVAVADHSIRVAAGEGYLDLLVVQPAGKTKMSVTDFLRGRELAAGIVLGEV